MCGIAGIINLNGSSVDSGLLDRVTDTLDHRGPDDRGIHTDGNVGLGFRRLAIIDLTEGGKQPKHSADGRYTLVFNGEIYNYREERAKLADKGHVFHTESDSEVLLALYEWYGEKCLEHLRGMFAFAIYDSKKKELFIARDRAGKKPVKYFHKDGVFAFASEFKALKHIPQCPKGIDEEALHHFLTMMYLPSPLTGIDGIQKLPAAHYLRINTETGEQELKRYWSLSYETDESKSYDEWKELVSSVLQETVQLRMISDVPLGAFLSGGIDSAAVVALMSRVSSEPIKTFSIGSDDPVFNELPDADITAKAFGTDHHPIPLEADIVHLLPELVATYEEPFADAAAMPLYLLSRKTRDVVTVALNGDGGDENFAGYVRYPIVRFSEKWRKLPTFLHHIGLMKANFFHSLAKNTFSYRSVRFQSSITQPLEERYLQYLSYFTDEEKRQLYNTDFQSRFGPTDKWYAELTAGARSRAHDPVQQTISMDIDSYLADDLLPKVDMGSMAHSLEARSPLLDHKLMEITARIPLRYKLSLTTRKFIFKEILEDILPAQVLYKKKRGFRLPLNRWFRRDLSDFVHDRLLDESSPMWSMFDRSAMEKFLKGYYGSKVDYSDHVWALLWLDEWMRQQ